MAPQVERFEIFDEHEQHQQRQAGEAFANACASGDADAMLEAADAINQWGSEWVFALQAVARLPVVAPEIQDAFLSFWIESKTLPQMVGNRRLLAGALSVLIRRTPVSVPVRIFRGTDMRERKRRITGFSWTTRIAVARLFAERWRPWEEGGVVLETLAPPEAILLMREETPDYDEAEVIVDPYKLGKVTMAERLQQGATSSSATDKVVTTVNGITLFSK